MQPRPMSSASCREFFKERDKFNDQFIDGYSLCTVFFSEDKIENFYKCFKSWIRNVDKPFEVNITINNGELKEIKDFFDYLQVEYNCVRLFFNNDNFGAAQGLNTSFVSSKYRYLIKLDDDAYIPDLNSDFLKRLKNLYESRPDTGVVGGISIDHSSFIFVRKIISEHYRNIGEIDKCNLIENFKEELHVSGFKRLARRDEIRHDCDILAKILKVKNIGTFINPNFRLQVHGCLWMFSQFTLHNYGILIEPEGRLHGTDDIEYNCRLTKSGLANITDSSLFFYHGNVV